MMATTPAGPAGPHSRRVAVRAALAGAVALATRGAPAAAALPAPADDPPPADAEAPAVEAPPTNPAGTVALTFDAGADRGYAESILDLLAEAHVRHHEEEVRLFAS